jgi:putative membrane protein
VATHLDCVVQEEVHMTIRMVIALGMVAALAFAPAVTFAQSSAPATSDKAAPADKSKMPSGDKKFVMEALKGGMGEVELGKLASEKASNDAVKQFGKRMADDHGKAGEELKKLAQDKGITPPGELDAKHKKLHDRLAKLSGADFDRTYMDEMVKDHRKDVKEFKREADKAKDPDVKAFAVKTLPTLEEHLKQAESVHAQVKSAAKAEKK